MFHAVATCAFPAAVGISIQTIASFGAQLRLLVRRQIIIFMSIASIIAMKYNMPSKWNTVRSTYNANQANCS